MTSPALRAAAEQIHAAWRWWIGELSELVPQRAQYWRRLTSVALVRPHADHVEIDKVENGLGEKFLETRALEEFDDDGWQDLALLTAKSRTRLALRAPDIFSTCISLPLAARRKWKSAAALQLDQIAPLDPEHLIWNAELREIRSDGISVRIVMARRSRIEALQSLFDAHDLRIPPIDAELEDGLIELAQGQESPVNRDARSIRRAIFASLGIILMVPAITIIAAFIMQASIDQEAAELTLKNQPKIEAERQWQKSERIRQALAFVGGRMLVSNLFEELATRLPASAYVQSVEQGPDRSVLIAVTTQEPKATAENLSKSSLLPHLQLIDQTQPDPEHMLLTFRATVR